MPLELVRDGKLDRRATAEALREFLESIVSASGLDLNVNVRAASEDGAPTEGEAEVLADLDGRDKEILLERGGDVLKAFEHLAFKALRLEPAYHEKIHIDSGGYRALRFEELKMTAKVAAERVQSTMQPFRLNPMSSRERRIVHLAVKDEAGFREDAEQGLRLGFEGKLCLHPRQVEIANAVYTPGPAQIDYARRVIAAWEDARTSARGVFTLDGKMIDAPLVAVQQRVLERARRAGALSGPSDA